MNPSPQQLSILSFLRSNETRVSRREPRLHCAINALAGTGKSTTIRMGMHLLSVEYGLSMAYCMLTSETVKDFERKWRNPRQKDVAIATAHAFGMRAIRLKHPATVDKNKVWEIFGQLWSETFNAAERKSLEREYKSISRYVVDLVSSMKDRLLLPDCQDSDIKSIINHFDLESPSKRVTELDLISWSRECLRRNNEIRDIVDFDDQIYLPLILNYQLPKFDYVFVDEAQDTNLARRTLYMKMLKPWGCCVIVGDQHQAIFGFAGADSGSMESFIATLESHRPGVAQFSLTVCYRCPLIVIEEAQKYVPEIQCGVGRNGYLASVGYEQWLKHELDEYNSTDVILCRFNRPLVMTCFALLKRRIPCRIEGRDIGLSLIKLLDRLGHDDLPSCSSALDRYQEQEIKKAKADEAHIALIRDKCDTLRLFLDEAAAVRGTVSGVRRTIEKLFTNKSDPNSDSQCLTLSTIHKAKGQEWERVFILGREQFMPSPWAKSPWEQVQEKNLIYVATTRSSDTLIHINEVPE